MGLSFLIAMVPEAIHSPIPELWNRLQGYAFRLFALSQQWQNHHNGQIRAVRINPQDKRKAEERCQQKIKAASHMPQVYLWSWWALKYPVHFSYRLPIIRAKCVLVYIWIMNILYSAPLLRWPVDHESLLLRTSSRLPSLSRAPTQDVFVDVLLR